MTDEIVRNSLMNLQASIWQHRSGEEPQLLCMATQLADDYWVTVADQGVDGFETKPPTWDVERFIDWRRPAERFSDLRLHSQYPGHPDDWERWVHWASLCPLMPLVLLSTSERPDRYRSSVMTVPMADLIARDYPKLWRIGYGSHMRNVRHMMEKPLTLRIAEGYLIHEVQMSYFRGGADNLHEARSLVAHACFDYPGPIDYGAPVVAENGSLAGVLVGGDLGPESSHQGAYIPAELITPFIQREHKQRTNARLSHFNVIHHRYPDEP